ncbi:MAG: T9SS type A sorting domain-containing protein [Saprospiraceae bacterium]
MRLLLTTLLLLIGFTVTAQNWETLDVNLDKENLELNPLKGIAANFGSDNGFPHTISNLTLSFGEISTAAAGVYDFSEIDAFLEEQATEGRYGIIQVNVDDSKLIHPNLADYFDPEDLDENGNPTRTLEAYKGAQHNLPAYLSAVPRAYYLGDRCPTCAADTDANGNSIEPYVGTAVDPQGNPSMVVDYNDPALMAAMLDFIDKLGDRYDEDQRMFIVHFGLYGIFGEWKLGFGKRFVPAGSDWAMSSANQDLITRAYGTSFPNTNLIARFPSTAYEPQSVGYSDGLYFGASFNDLDPNQTGFFLRELTLFNSQENWRNKPIGGEMDPYLQGSIWGNDPNEDIIQKVVANGDPQLVQPAPQKIEDVLLRTHPTFIFQNYILKEEFVGLEGATHVVPASAANPTDSTRQAAQFPFAGESNQVFWDNALLATKRIGYTFFLDQFRVTAENSTPAVEVNLTNKGVAPMYANWDVEFGYLDGTNVVSLGKSSSWNLSTILPDVISNGQVIENNSDNKRAFVSDELLPDPNGSYTFLVRIINPLKEGFNLPDGTFKQYANASAVRFANTTQDEDVDGWLTLGEATLINGNLGTVPEVALSITAGPFNNTMNLGSQQQLTAITDPVNTDVVWETNRPLTATVDQNGMVTTANDRGLVTITATTSNGLQASFEILVSAKYELPAFIEAESYSGISTDIDDGNPFNDIDILVIPEGDDEGEIVIQRFKSNSYLDFDVIVNQAEGYIFDFKAANSGGAGDAKMDIILLTDGSTLGSVEFNRPAGGGTNFDVYDSESITLPQGEYTLRFAVAEGKTAFNLDWIRVRRDDPCEFPGFIAGGACDDRNGNTIDDTFEDVPNCNCTGIPGSARVFSVPGTIQAEHWASVSSNTFDATGAVVTTSTDPSQVITLPKYAPGVENGEGYFVGGLDFLDRLDYNIDATVTDDYTLGFRVAAPQQQGTNTASGELTIKIDGVTRKANFQLMDTDGPNPDPTDFGDFSIYNLQLTEPIEITAGPHTLQLEITIGSFDLNFIDIQPANPCTNFDLSLIGTACDDGDPTTVNDVYTSTCECVGTTSGIVFNPIPALIEAEDFSAVFNAQVNPVPAGETGGSVLGFIADDTWMEYAVTVAEADDFVLDLRASSPFGIGVVDILNDAGQVLTTVPLGPIVEANNFDAYGTFTSNSFTLPAGSYVIRIDVAVSAFNLNWIEFKLANPACPNPVGSACDDADPTTVNDVYTSTCECAGTPSGIVFNPIPSLIEAEDFSAVFNAQVNPVPAGETGGSVLGFIADDTWMEYAVTVTEADDFVLDLRASSPFGIGVVDILDDDGQVLTTVPFGPIVEANNFDAYGTFISDAFALPAGSYVLRVDVVVSAFNLNWIEFRLANSCPNPIGTACDDGDACTTNDVVTVDCGCEGTFADADADGVCDADDVCPTLDDNLIGTACDDGNACTTEDVYTTDCGCEGTFADADADGVCDADDVCPTLDDNLIGTACDDGNACTTEDVYTNDCGCEGTFADADADGVCDADDVCPAFDDNLIGTPCDDGLACTIDDVYTTNCDCAGTAVNPELIQEHFDNSLGQFVVSSGAFSSSKPTYESFTQQPNSVLLEVGGVDNSTQGNMSFGISTSFNTYGTDAIVTIDYELLADEGYDQDEWTEAILEIDGQRVIYNGNDYLSRLVAGAPSTTGNQSAAIRLTGLAPGAHTMVLGLLNNKKTYNTESSAMRIDFINVTEDCSTNTCVVGAPCNDGNPSTTNDAYTINCLCEGSVEVVLDAIHDAYLQGSARFDNDILRVENNNRKSYLKFDLSSVSGSVEAIELVMNVDNDPGNGRIEVSKGSHVNWTETNLSTSNMPTQGTLLGALNGSFDQGQSYAWNLTPGEFNGSEISLVVEHVNGNDVSFKSSENSDVSNRPRLIIHYTPTTTCTSAGQSCDDGESCTENDVYDAACNCSGTYIGDVLIDENFSNTTGAFTVTSGAFSNSNTTYENFTQEATSAVLGAGGVDNSTKTNMSLGLSTTFDANGTDDIAIQIDYELIVDEGYDSDEWTKAIVTVDGQPITYNGNNFLSQLIAGSPTTTGEQSVTLILPGLTAGNHTLTIGLLNNKKTYNTEYSEMIIDKVKVTQGCPQAINALVTSTSGTANNADHTSLLEDRSSFINQDDVEFELNVYPNPTSDFFWVKFYAEASNNVTVKVLDVNGREVFVKQQTEVLGAVSQEINTSEWAAGTYTVVVQAETFVKTERVFILK